MADPGAEAGAHGPAPRLTGAVNRSFTVPVDMLGSCHARGACRCAATPCSGSTPTRSKIGVGRSMRRFWIRQMPCWTRRAAAGGPAMPTGCAAMSRGSADRPRICAGPAFSIPPLCARPPPSANGPDETPGRQRTHPCPRGPIPRVGAGLTRALSSRRRPAYRGCAPSCAYRGGSCRDCISRSGNGSGRPRGQSRSASNRCRGCP